MTFSLLSQQVAKSTCFFGTCLSCILPLMAHGLVLFGAYVVLKPYLAAFSYLAPYLELILKNTLF